MARRADRRHICSDQGPNWLGQLVDPAAAWTRDRVGRDRLLSPQLLGPGSESAETADPPRISSVPGPMGWDSWSTLCQLGHGTEGSWIAGRPHSSSAPYPSRLVQLIDTASDQSQDQRGPEPWSTLGQLGPGTESSKIAGRPHSSLDQGPRRPELLVDMAAALTQDRGGWDS